MKEKELEIYPPVKASVARIPLGPLILQEILAKLLFAAQLYRVLAIGTLNSDGNTMETMSPLISLVEGVIVKK